MMPIPDTGWPGLSWATVSIWRAGISSLQASPVCEWLPSPMTHSSSPNADLACVRVALHVKTGLTQ